MRNRAAAIIKRGARAAVHRRAPGANHARAMPAVNKHKNQRLAIAASMLWQNPSCPKKGADPVILGGRTLFWDRLLIAPLSKLELDRGPLPKIGIGHGHSAARGQFLGKFLE